MFGEKLERSQIVEHIIGIQWLGNGKIRAIAFYFWIVYMENVFK